MSEPEEPPAKVLKIDNFDRELSIPEIEPLGNGSTVPDGLGDAASIVDGDTPDISYETADDDLNDAEIKATEQVSADNRQEIDKSEEDLTDAEQISGEILDKDNVEQELDNTDEDVDKTYESAEKSIEKLDQGMDIVDQGLEKLNQEVDKLNQDMDEFDQNVDKSDQDVEQLGQDLDKIDQDVDESNQDVEKLGQDVDKVDQNVDKIDQGVEKLCQNVEKFGQDVEKLGQVLDKHNQGLENDQEASGSQEETEGHEEWLSEGILTDDDLNASASTHQNGDGTSQNKLNQLETKTVELNIEETLNHLDGSMEQDDGETEKVTDKNKPAIKEEPILMKHEPSDGNDTDDLLRMLGGDEHRGKKKLTKTVGDLRSVIRNVIEASDDDDFEYDETSIRKLKVAKNAISKKAPPKAVPEDLGDGDDDDSDQSSDEALAKLKKTYSAKKTYSSKKPNILNRKLARREMEELVVVKTRPDTHPVNVVTRSEKPVIKKSTSILKSSSRSILKTSTPAKMVASKPNPDKTRIEFKPPPIKTPTPFRAGQILKTLKVKKEDPEEEEYTEEDFLTNDNFDSDIEENRSSHQRIMKPERMEEEVPSDGDSCDEDGSLYDELPSSESDDMDDWFQIDIRAERATEYLPLLGSKARDLLLEEKHRSAVRVTNLRQSLAALTESGKNQAEELRKATMSLAELDDMLKAS